MAKTNTKSGKKKTTSSNGNGTATGGRVEVAKTYKLFIGGKFPRTESGRYYQPEVEKGNKLNVNICRSSRKDFRNAVVAAGKAQMPWAERSAYNRSQILYRIGEMLEGRKAQFVHELQQQGSSKANAEKEVSLAIDRLIYYAGWCDKYQQVFSAVNPVASSHFNFTLSEPTGTVAAIAPENSGLIGLVTAIAPVIAGGNTIVVLASESKAVSAISFAEVLHTSDVPAGVVNILTGFEKELADHISTHMDVKALLYYRDDFKEKIRENAADNLKRIVVRDFERPFDDDHESPYRIREFQEMKTTWHPVENIGGKSSSY